jgi:ATP-dependent Clp protease protease subunit
MNVNRGGASGQASDIAIHAKEILEIRERLNKLYVKHTSQPLSMIGILLLKI